MAPPSPLLALPGMGDELARVETALRRSVVSEDPHLTELASHLIQAKAIFPLTNPGVVSIPLGFVAAIVAALATREESAEETFSETNVRANLGLGAEV